MATPPWFLPASVGRAAAGRPVGIAQVDPSLSLHQVHAPLCIPCQSSCIQEMSLKIMTSVLGCRSGRTSVMRRAQTLRDVLEDEIVTGKFRPGERLDEQSLAARFAVSRTPDPGSPDATRLDRTGGFAGAPRRVRCLAQLQGRGRAVRGYGRTGRHVRGPGRPPDHRADAAGAREGA